jgi:ferredoxin-NADP reductase
LICTVPRNRKSLQPGQAMYLLIPIISKMEWHPFSISKCVGEDNIQFHIKTLGNWTGRLHQLTVENRMRDQRIFIVGPITTTVAKYKRFDKVIFIGSGIGVTPFISILSGMMSDSMTKLKIYHLHWLVPSQDAAKEWFRDIFQDIERCESHHAIKVTIWFTRGRRASNLAEMHALQLFQSIYTTSTGKDLFSGLSIAHNRIKVRCGKPSWEKEFNAISEDFGIAECNQSRPIGVFCCAHQSIRKDLIRVQRKHFTDGPFQMHFEKFNHWS